MTNFEAGSDSADRELVLSHRIDAPRDRVSRMLSAAKV
jgi:hypothetical protein